MKFPSFTIIVFLIFSSTSLAFSASQQVMNDQRALLSLGYNVGKADGVSGPNTRWMIEAFQRAYGYKATGRLNAQQRADLEKLAQDVNDFRTVIKREIHPRIKRTKPEDAYNGASFIKYPALTYANGYHAALARHRQIPMMSNGYQAKFFDFNRQVEEWQHQNAKVFAEQSGDSYGKALVTLQSTYQPLPDFWSEVFPAIELIVEEAHKNFDEPAYVYRAFASFEWQFQQNAGQCEEDNISAKVLPLIQRTIELFKGPYSSLPAQGKFLQIAANCSSGGLAKSYLDQRTDLAFLINPKAAASVARDNGLRAFDADDFETARREFQKMHSLIVGQEFGYRAGFSNNAIAGIDVLEKLLLVGLEKEAEIASSAIVSDFEALSPSGYLEPGSGSTALYFSLEAHAISFMKTKRLSALKRLGIFLSAGDDPWAAAVLGANLMFTSKAFEDAQQFAFEYAELAAGEGFKLPAARLASVEAESALMMGRLADAEVAVTKAIALANEAGGESELDVKLGSLRGELGLSNAEAIASATVIGPKIAEFFTRACETDVLGAASEYWVEFNHDWLASDRDNADHFIKAGVLKSMRNCSSEHLTFRGSGRLFCHLAVANKQPELAQSFIEQALGGAYSQAEESLECAMGMADANGGTYLKPFSNRFAKLGEDAILLQIASLPQTERSGAIRALADTHEIKTGYGELDIIQFLKERPQDQRKEAIADFRETYFIFNSGASMTREEEEYILNQALDIGRGWLSLGLPDIAEVYFGIDERFDPFADDQNEDGWASNILASDEKLRLVLAHAQIAKARGDGSRTRELLAPLVQGLLGELTESGRALGGTVEQFAKRGRQVFSLWLEVAPDGENSSAEAIMVQQALTLSNSNAGISQLDERVRSEDPALLRDFQDSRRALRVLQNQPSSVRDPVKLAALSNDFERRSGELDEILTNSGGAFGLVLGSDEINNRLAALGDASVLVLSQLNNSLLRTWIVNGFIETEIVEISSREMEELVSGYREQILRTSDLGGNLPTKLSEVLLGTKWTDYAPDIRIVVDGPAAAVPFAALSIGDNQWLGAQSKLRVSPTLAWALEPDIDRIETTRPFLGIGAANFASSDVLGYELVSLPETETELRFLAAALGGDPVADVLLADKASRRSLFELNESGALSEYSILSFATHGLLSNDQSKTGLALTPEDAADDGIFGVEDIVQLKLNADLVVLSACNTGSPGADGVLSGLASAFFYAGASGLIVSHWDVDSGATLELMRLMALALNEGKDKHTALSQAISTMATAGSGFDHPKYWAAFFLVG